MKIVFTGGGTGGHFYPIIAVAQELNQLIKERHLVDARLYYFSTESYNSRLLFENAIEFRSVKAGKRRRYFSLLNFFDCFKTGWGILSALWQLYWLYPDVVFSKGGYAAFPVLVAARLLRLPVFIHESDSHPGRVSLWSAKFARRVALSYPEALTFFPAAKSAVTGNPIRREIQRPISEGAYEFLKLDPAVPVLFVTGGSQGAQMINDTVVDLLPQLVEKYQIIHQTGTDNLEDIKKRSSLLLQEHPQRERYKVFPYLNATALQMTVGVAALIITRAGSVLFEIANWGLPAIIIPIPAPISHDQETNAFTYARSGGAVVIEQGNLTPSVLLGEINRLMTNPALLQKMREGAKSFARPDAGKVIAEEIVNIALEHEE